MMPVTKVRFLSFRTKIPSLIIYFKHTHYQFRIRSVLHKLKKACADIILSQTIKSEALKAFLKIFKKDLKYFCSRKMCIFKEITFKKDLKYKNYYC
jgi:hypothetical protein